MSRDALAAYPAPIHDLASTPSTNTLAREALERDAVDGELFIAAEQTAGRGRIGRSWFSPGAQGNLYLSLVVRREGLPLALVPQLTLAAGVAMSEALEATFGVATRLKWPNDLLAGPEHRKLGGILCEGVSSGATLRGVVVGVGVNLCGSPSEFPAPLDATATTVEHVLGRRLSAEGTDRYGLAAAFVAAFSRRIGEGAGQLAGALAGVREAWRARAHLPGRVVLDDGRSGTAHRLDEHGRLVIVLDGQPERELAIESGELTWL